MADARAFGVVPTALWRKGHAARGLSTPGRLLLLYLLTAPTATLSGLYRLSRATMAEETGLDGGALATALAECERAGLVRFDAAHDVVWVVPMAAAQLGARLKPGDRRVVKVRLEVEAVADSPLARAFHDAHRAAYHLPALPGLAASSADAPSQGEPMPHAMPHAAAKRPRRGRGALLRGAVADLADRPASAAPVMRAWRELFAGEDALRAALTRAHPFASSEELAQLVAEARKETP